MGGGGNNAIRRSVIQTDERSSISLPGWRPMQSSLIGIKDKNHWCSNEDDYGNNDVNEKE